MGPDGFGGIKNSSKSKHGLKKGPWTAGEDMLLVEYVKKQGEGNWNAVQRNSGLMRCGKSCRLRWANHLRPNLKKGSFSSDEEKLIVELHAKLDNKWARMAAQLRGRTDNEIKNYWNTRLKRHQRAGLPIYPQELDQDENQQLYSSSKSPLSSLLLATSHHPNPNPLHFFNSFNRPPIQIIPSYNTQELKLFHDDYNNNNLTLSLAASNPPTFLNQGLADSLLVPSIIHDSSFDFGSGVGVSGLPSIQSAVTTAAFSSEFVIETSSDDVGDYEMDGFSRRKNSGLLEDLLGELQALTGKTENSCIAAAENDYEKDFFSFGHGDENNIEGKSQMGHREGINFMEDDLLNLLDNFPLAVPIPDWNQRNKCDEPPKGTNGTVESHPEDTQYNPVAISYAGAENQEWSLGSCLWSDMPNIY